MENLSKAENTTEVDTGIKVEDMGKEKGQNKKEEDGKSSPKEFKLSNRDESHLEIKSDDNFFEHNTDSNKSSNNFQTPYVHSSSGSNKDGDYMTPKSMHNLNLLFTQSNGKKSQQGPKRIMSNVNIDSSPMDNRVYMNYPYQFPISPIDPLKINRGNNISNYSNIQLHQNQNMHPLNPHYVFNNNEGVMSINIQNKYVYDRAFAANRRVNRKIEFTRNDEAEGSTHLKSENIKIDEDRSITESFSSSEEANQAENEIKKPQPRMHSSLQKINDSVKESLYLRPFQPFSETISKMRYSFSKLTPQEYQKKTQEELDKKKFSCNCKRSKCLKLYCECFANGEFCINCNCQDCSNIIGNEEEKEDAFKIIKDKNPVAMKLNNIKEVIKEENAEAKIGCNCTKSNCSKKYCECYKAGVQCTEICRCRDCENSSSKCREFKRKTTVSSIEDSDSLVYNYANFNIEKISVYIQNTTINIDKTSYENIDKFLNKDEVATNSVTFKRINDSFFIEFPKSILTNVLPASQTPVVHKFKKRRRNASIDSSNSNEFNHITKTACDTNKKINNRRNMGMGNVVGKRLILDG